MRILGIDPGLAACGWGVIDITPKLRCVDYGYIQTEPTGNTKTDDTRERCHLLAARIADLIRRFEPDELALEAFVFFSKAITTSFQIKHAIGAICEIARSRGIETAEYPTQTVKMAVARNRKAEKKTIAAFVRSHLGMKEVPRPFHASDALAVAICHASKRIHWGRRA